MKFVLCWHMHQPYYRDELQGVYHLPWVYLHAMKDYSDMAWHLEQHPGMRLVVNFAPVLLEQLLDYSTQLDAFLTSGKPLNDSLLNLLAGVTPIPQDVKARLEIIRHCQRCNGPTMIEPWPAFKALAEYPRRMLEPQQVHGTEPVALGYLNEQYFHDLLTWYHLAWLGYSYKQQTRVRALLDKRGGYTLADRLALLGIIRECISDIIPRYKRLAGRGQIELSMTPWGHPIVPLLNDFSNASCALPEAPRPTASAYPGGRSRSRWHMRQGIELFDRCFGRKPHGVWLSEGSISKDALELLDEFDMQWTASGENVWRNSARLSKLAEQDIASKRGLFQAYHASGGKCRIFFRDDGLSDLIGFEYRNWDAGDAVANFIMHLRNITKFLDAAADDCCISVILDGENAWEYYPDNGVHFIERLYRALIEEPGVETITFSQAATLPAVKLPSICPGSWVFGSFSTWIGDAEKNRAWDLLVEAKRDYDRFMDVTTLDEQQRTRITRQLAICEGSDWFWWFGDYNPSESVQDFDQLYRSQLRMLYQLMGMPAPPSLEIPISMGKAQTRGGSGTMRRN
ncbi:MAG: glycoside hydrolase family 57 protein [Pseudomonadota bacterium]